MRRNVLPMLLLTATLVPFLGSADAGAEFIPLGVDRVDAVSVGGRVVVGSNAGDAYRWVAGRVESLFEPGDLGSAATAVSADGSVLAGTQDNVGTDVVAFVWDESTGVREPLDSLPSEPGNARVSTDAFGISGDGRVIVGTTGFSSSSSATVWRDGVVSALPPLARSVGAPTPLAFAVDASRDGFVIAGTDETGPRRAVRWDDGQVTELALLPGAVASLAAAVSTSGTTVVGLSRFAPGTEATLWEGGSVVGLGFMAGHDQSEASDVSGDGSIVVGRSWSGTEEDLFWWDEATGMRPLAGELALRGAAVPDGWTLTSVSALADDASAVVGHAINPQGELEGWLAVIPEPSTGLLLLVGLLALKTRSRS